jgi:hypothetical protein
LSPIQGQGPWRSDFLIGDRTGSIIILSLFCQAAGGFHNVNSSQALFLSIHKTSA